MNDTEPAALASTAPLAAPRSGLGTQMGILTLAVIGGFLGILGSLVTEIQHGSDDLTFILPIIIAAPMIEEAMKPSGVYLALIRWPHALTNQVHVAFLCAIGGLVFGLIESWVYVNLYVSDPTEEFIRCRYTVPVSMHVLCSFIFGLGVNRGIIDWANGHGRLPGTTRRAYLAAAGVHGLYNLMAIVLAVAGVLDFGEE